MVAEAGERATHEREAHERRVERAVLRATEEPDRLLCIVGPTASGKTDLAIDVCTRIRGEVISADSIQIYRYFDKGSGKVTAEEQARVPHRLIDVLDPLTSIDAAAYARLADEAIREARARGNVPVLCGGTFFWVRALVLGLVPAPAADEQVRALHRAIVAERGRAALHDELARVDPASAARLHPNDVLRVGRALEVHALSGRPMSEWQREHGFREPRMNAAMIGVQSSPEALRARIAQRVDRWLADGWIDEVRDLTLRGYGEARAMGSVGYREIRKLLAGNLSRDDLREDIVHSTHVFARKQRTWLRQAPVEWL